MASADLLTRCLADLPAAARALHAGETTAAELVAAALTRAAAWEPRLHAFAWLDPQRARQLAAEADGRRRSGQAPRALEGVPIGVKDIFDTAGIPTENGTSLHHGRVPARTAPAVESLERAGAIVLGKTVTTELAFYRPGPTRNPWNSARTPGGSSMGSAAGVAAGIFPGAVGSQTNGSVVRPAAFCGVVGFKPSHGLIPLQGVLPFAPTLDTVGSFARSVEGAAWLAALMAGDPAQGWTPPRPRAAGMPAPRLALVVTSDFALAEPAMRARFEADVAGLRRAGAEVEQPPLPAGLDEDALRIHRVIMAREAHQSLGATVAEGPDQVGPQLRGLLEEGAKTPVADYEAALRERARMVEALMAWAAPFDGLLTLPTAGEAPPPETTGDPRFCTRWSLLGAPALTLPTGLGPSGLPLGLQVVGRPGEDARLVAVAAWIEQCLPAPVGPPQP